MMTLSMAAEALHSKRVGDDVEFEGVSIDTRRLKPGDLFFALKGENYDGHNFLAEALRAGAVGAVLHRPIHTEMPYLLTENTRIALGDLAAFWRRHFDIPVIGVTGSNGKTTVKEMIGAIMENRHRGLITEGNLNNDIGVPLTLLRLRRAHRYAVVEMGMNHPGEIYYVSTMTRPTIAVITNAGEAHLQGTGDVATIARIKGEIFAGLSRDGIAVINADDDYASLWRGMVEGRRCITFGLKQKASVNAEYELDARGCRVRLHTTEGDIDMRMSLLGKQNVMNAMAATAASLAAGAGLADIKRGLERLRAVSGRLELKQGINGARVIDDTYNANPASLSVGLEVLKDAGGERVLVLGDMAELGEAAPAIHRRVGEMAKRIGVNRLFAMGELTGHTVQGFGSGARHYSSHQALVEDLIDCLHADMTLLVKGSRVMRMEQVVKGIMPQKLEAGAD